MTITIREATPDDAEIILNHVKTVLAEPNSFMPVLAEEFPHTSETKRELLLKNADSLTDVYFIAELNGQIVGALNLWGSKQKSEKHQVRLGISVHRDFREQGIGTQLMSRAIDWAKQAPGVSRIELEVLSNNRRAIHIYEKLGFVIEGRRRRAYRYQDGWVDALIMGILFPEDCPT